MSDIICKCGHSIDYHQSLGCQHTDDTDNRKWCACQRTRDNVELIALRAELTALRQVAAIAAFINNNRHNFGEHDPDGTKKETLDELG